MSKEIIKINNRKQLKAIIEKNSPATNPETAWNQINKDPEILEINDNEKSKNFSDRKLLGAVKEIFRRKKLDENIENSLSEDLTTNSEFISASNKIDEKRNWLISKIDNFFGSDVKMISEEAIKELTEDLKKSAEEIDNQEANNFDRDEADNRLEAVSELGLTEESEEKKEIVEVNIKLEAENKPEEKAPVDAFANLFNKNVFEYAKSIGIKPEQLATNSEFLSLSPEQQQFALETLRRSSLAKVKVKANESFIQEKASKKWWQLGFSMNQNYHKERHKIETIKNIESRGLEGYGETELSWLVDVIKNGPEVKMNDQGEILVNFLKESDFNEKQKELVEKYNKVARDYIEYKPQKNKTDERGKMAVSLDDIRRELLNKEEDFYECEKLKTVFLKSRNNIELLRFLSADKETEKVLDRLAATPTTGFDKFKGLVSGNKDKAGYSTLGFALRTGSKFALANSAYLATALSYSVAPLAAAIVGGLRAYNNTKKDLSEKESLAFLGVKDKSGLAKTRNLVSYYKEKEDRKINFGLTEKLEDLIAKSKNREYEEYEIGSPEYEKAFDKHKELINKLVNRIEYTQLKINRDEVDFGSINNRNANYAGLIKALEEAQIITDTYTRHRQHSKLFYLEDDKYRGDTNIPEKYQDESDEAYKLRLSQDKKFVKYQNWATDEKRLKELSELSLEERLRSFLKLQEKKQTKKEEKYLIKKVATGALVGTGFATIGALLAESFNAGNWLGEHVSKGHYLKNNLDLENNKTSSAVITENYNYDNNSVESNENLEISNPSEHVSETVTIKTGGTEIFKEGKSESAAIKLEAVVDGKFTDEISNEGLNGRSDSVWRSTREIFKNNASKLGYQGNLNDQTAIDNWAEIQTAKTISSSNDISDRVFEGNKVVLTRDETGFKVNVEQAGGFKPGQLENKYQTAAEENVTEEVFKTNTNITSDKYYETKNDNIEVYNLDDSSLKQSDSIVSKVDSVADDRIEGINRSVDTVSNNLVKPKESFIYQKEIGSAQLDYKNGNLELKLIDKNGSKIPNNFINEIRGKMSLDKFIDKNLDKTFKSWNKLSNDDQGLYKILSNNPNKDELLRQIKTQFKLDNNVKITPDNRLAIQTLNKQEYFDLNFKGLKKMLKFTSKIF